MNHVYKTVFLKIIFSPRKAFATIETYELFKYHYYLFGFAGINNILVRNWLDVADSSNNLLVKLIKYIAAGAFLGWLPLLFVSWLIFHSGKWLKGQAEFLTIANLMGYAFFYPVFLSLISTISNISFLRLNGFNKSDYYNNLDINSHSTFELVIHIHRYINWGFNIYYAVLIVIAISVIQGFTIIKSMLNIFLAVLIIVIPLGLMIIIPSILKY